jgi:hypothetical protein
VHGTAYQRSAVPEVLSRLAKVDLERVDVKRRIAVKCEKFEAMEGV